MDTQEKSNTKAQFAKTIKNDLTILFYYIANIFLTYYTYGKRAVRWLPRGQTGLFLLAAIVIGLTVLVFYFVKVSLWHYFISIGIVVLYYTIFPKHYGGLSEFDEIFEVIFVFGTFILQGLIICVIYSKISAAEEESAETISAADENMISRKIDSCLDAIAEREAEILADLFCRELKNDVTNTLFKQIQGAFDGIGTGRIVFQRDNVQVNKQTVRDSGEIKLYCREYVYGASVEGGGEMRVSIMLHHIWERHNEFVGIGGIVINRADGTEFVIGRRGYPYEDC